MRNYCYIFIITFLFVACSGGGGSSSKTSVSTFSLNTLPELEATISKLPVVNSTWNIQLQGTVNENYSVDMYEVDLFDSSSALINRLKSNGIKVICYFNAGAWENWRSDANNFSTSVLGTNLSGYPDEKWLDISNPSLMSIMEARLDLAVSKGCDGVDPDNMDGYTQNSGFTLSYNDQLAYNRYIANEARTRDLSVALKNNLNQIDDLIDYYDFAVNEQCFFYGECDLLDKFITEGKAVFNIEYDSTYVNNTNSARDNMCSDSNSKNFSSLVLSLELDDTYRDSCK